MALLLFAGVISAGEEPTGQQAHWLQNFEEAKQHAAEQGLPLLISFSGSDWCVPCMRLERDLFTTSEFIHFSKEHLILLKLDFPARKKNLLSEEQLQHNEALAEIYNIKGAFPLVVITNPNGEVTGTMDHPLSSVEAYINSIQSAIRK